eukprot:jgi/Botrbrau1/240/Bobra.0022s0215.1
MISPECEHLLKSLLHPDPRKRMRLETVLKHPWFLHDLPPGTLDMNNVYLNQPVDNAVIEAVDTLVEAAISTPMAGCTTNPGYVVPGLVFAAS